MHALFTACSDSSDACRSIPCLLADRMPLILVFHFDSMSVTQTEYTRHERCSTESLYNTKVGTMQIIVQHKSKRGRQQ